MKQSRYYVEKIALGAYALLWACSLPPADDRPGEGLGLISIQEEKQMGYYVDAAVSRQFLPLEDRNVLAAINEMGQKILAQTLNPGFEFTFKVLNDPVENAFALPGGSVYITTGLLEKLKTKDQVAAVLSHEVSHIIARHPARALHNAQVAAAIYGTLSLGASLGMAAAGQPRAAADLARLATALVTVIVYQGYSRDLEMQADRLGLKYLRNAGYNPKGMPEVFRIFLEIQKQKEAEGKAKHTPGIFSSHPDMEQRLETVKRLIEEGDHK